MRFIFMTLLITTCLFTYFSSIAYSEDIDTAIISDTTGYYEKSRNNKILEITSNKDNNTSKHVKVFTVIDRIYDINISRSTFKIEAEILLTWINTDDHFK